MASLTTNTTLKDWFTARKISVASMAIIICNLGIETPEDLTELDDDDIDELIKSNKLDNTLQNKRLRKAYREMKYGEANKSPLMSQENSHYVMSVLENGKVPSLPFGCTHHFFMSKDEKFKETSILIATWLIGLGFSVWESNLEKEQGRSLTPEAMQRGVQNAAVVILLLTPGIFHTERHFVWKTEIKYALEECHKPLMVLKLPRFSSEKCNSIFATTVEMHHVECCDGTDQDYQPWIRAILRVPTRVTWKLSGVDKKREVMQEFRKIHDRDYLEDEAFRKEINRQCELHLEHGACLSCTRMTEGETKTTQQVVEVAAVEHSDRHSGRWTNNVLFSNSWTCCGDKNKDSLICSVTLPSMEETGETKNTVLVKQKMLLRTSSISSTSSTSSTTSTSSNVNDILSQIEVAKINKNCQQMIHAIKDGISSIEVAKKGCIDLRNLSCNPKNNAEIVSNDGIILMLEILKRHGSAPLLEGNATVAVNGCVVLYNLCFKKENQYIVMDAGGMSIVDKLQRWWSTKNNEQVQEWSEKILSKLRVVKAEQDMEQARKDAVKRSGEEANVQRKMNSGR